MLATKPPTEHPIPTRAAILTLAREKVGQLRPTEADLDAIPAWLWSLASFEIARSLVLDPHMFCREIAAKLEDETTRRHPAEKYVAFLTAQHPHLSHVQRARLAEYAYHFNDEYKSCGGVVTNNGMLRRGFTNAECDTHTRSAVKLIAAFDQAGGSPPASDRRNSLDVLRDAGDRAHARRAMAEGDLEFDAAAAARVATTTDAQAAR